MESIVAKFKSWRAQKSAKQFYDARLNSFKDGKKKGDYKSVSITVDLSKKSYLLLSEAKGKVKNNNDIDFPF